MKKKVFNETSRSHLVLFYYATLDRPTRDWGETYFSFTHSRGPNSPASYAYPLFIETYYSPQTLEVNLNPSLFLFKHEFLGASRSYFFLLLLLLTLHEISLYFTLITQNLSLSFPSGNSGID